MRIIFLFVAVLAACCGQKPKESLDVKPHLITAFRKYIASKGLDSLFSIDTLFVYRLDTLTPKTESEFRISALLNKAATLQSNGKTLGAIYELSAQKAILNASLFGRNNPLTQISKGEAEKAKANFDQNMTTLKSLLEHTDSLNRILISGGLDSTSVLGYRPVFILKSVNKASGVLSVDSITMRFDLKYNALVYSDLESIR